MGDLVVRLGGRRGVGASGTDIPSAARAWLRLRPRARRQGRVHTGTKPVPRSQHGCGQRCPAPDSPQTNIARRAHCAYVAGSWPLRFSVRLEPHIAAATNPQSRAGPSNRPSNRAEGCLGRPYSAPRRPHADAWPSLRALRTTAARKGSSSSRPPGAADVPPGGWPPGRGSPCRFLLRCCFAVALGGRRPQGAPAVICCSALQTFFDFLRSRAPQPRPAGAGPLLCPRMIGQALTQGTGAPGARQQAPRTLAGAPQSRTRGAARSHSHPAAPTPHLRKRSPYDS